MSTPLQEGQSLFPFTLREGAEGPGVALLQFMLWNLGCFKQPETEEEAAIEVVTGFYGLETTAAVQKLQLEILQLDPAILMNENALGSVTARTYEAMIGLYGTDVRLIRKDAFLRATMTPGNKTPAFTRKSEVQPGS